MRKITFLKMMLLAVILLVGSGSASGQNIAIGTPYTQNFDGIGSTATASLPSGWKIENIATVRSVTTAYASVPNTATANALTYNAAMATNAANGSWNFGGGSATDRAVGGISSGTASKSVNMYLQLINNGVGTINNFTISYDAERYRNGSNTAGFSIRLYYSTTGATSTWTEITDCVASFAANSDINGATTNPLETINITNKTLNQSLAAGSSIYLAWSYSVTSGTTTSNAQALGIDNISIVGNAGTPATADPTFSPVAGTYTSAQNVTLSSNTSGANIYYTLNGDTPNSTVTSTNFLYSSSIVLNTTATTTIKAIAYDALNANPSSVASATYVINLNPAITVSKSTLTDFTYPQSIGPSAEQTFTVSGVNLTHNISIAAITDYEISLTSGTGFTTPFTLTQSGGNVATTTVYVRLKAGLSQGSYNGEVINVTSTDATSATVTCSGSVTAPPSALPFVENFDFTSGTDLTTNGWNITGSNATPTVAVSTASITYPGYLSSGVGNEITLSSTGGQDVNKIFVSQTSGTIYASFLVNVTSATTGGDYFFHLGPQTIGTNYKGRVFVKSSGSGIVFGIAQTSTPVYSSTVYNLNTTYLVVLKYSIVSGAANDLAAIYINPTLNAPEPTSWIASTETPSDPSDIGSVALRQGSSSAAPALKLAGIRISTNWQDIVGTIPTFSGTGDLTETARWSTGSVPGTSANVIIDGDATISTNTVLDGITINSGKSVTVNAGKQLTISITLTNNGTLNLLSTAADGTATILTPTTITGSGTTNVQQWLTTGRNWYISSPVSGATATTFNPAGSSNLLYSYDEAHGSTAPWPAITDNTTGLTVMQGYVANMAADGAVTFSGILNTGSKNITVNRTVGQTKEGFNLVGNPYASYLDWDMVTKSASLQTSIWQRSKNAGNTWVFDTYNSTGQLGINNSGKRVNNHIPPMQAFWVRVDNGQTSGSLTVDNTMRSHAGSQTTGLGTVTDPVFKAPVATTLTQLVLRLQVSNGTNTDEAIIYSNPNASNSFDSYDSQKMFNNSASIAEIYTLAGTEDVAINGLNTIPYDSEIALGFSTSTSGSFSIKASEISNFDAGIHIILKDNLLNTEKDITDGSVYTFSSDAVNTTTRFTVLFKTSSVINGLNNNPADSNAITVYKNAQNRITINCSNVLSGLGAVSVYNMIGEKLASQALIGTTTVLNKSFASGVYLVSVVSNGKTSTHKIIIN